jgi:hypothetical protein
MGRKDTGSAHGSDFVFLSTSRVYSIDALRALPLGSNDSRFFLRGGVQQPGVGATATASREINFEAETLR